MADTLDPANLHAVFKAYDVRGTVPDQLDEDLARATGRAFVEVVGARPWSSSATTCGRARPAWPARSPTGASDAGADVMMIGLASTDQLYFASGHLGHPGAMFTASHNPAQYNGIKMCRAYAAADRHGDRPGRDPRPGARRRPGPSDGQPGRSPSTTCSRRTPPTCSSLAPVARPPAEGGRRRRQRHGRPHRARRLRRGSATRSTLVPHVLRARRHLPEPRGQPDRAGEPRRPPAGRVLAEGADIGLAFDGDADRCFLVDERGRAVSPSTLTALIAARELAKEPGATVIHNLITSRAVPEIVTELGGTPVRTRVGHSYIKATMAETDAIFGGEHSGHFYFRDFWRADSGMLAALHTLAALAETDRPLSALLAEYERYVAERRDQLRGRRPGRRDRAEIEAAYAGRDGVTHRPPRRAHRQPRRLVVQRPPVQHRAAAPAQRRGHATRRPWRAIRDDVLAHDQEDR